SPPLSYPRPHRCSVFPVPALTAVERSGRGAAGSTPRRYNSSGAISSGGETNAFDSTVRTADMRDVRRQLRHVRLCIHIDELPRLLQHLVIAVTLFGCVRGLASTGGLWGTLPIRPL